MEKQTVMVPQSWDDISVKTYQRIMALSKPEIMQDKEEKEYEENFFDEINYQIKMLSIYLDCDEKLVRNMDSNEMSSIIKNDLKFLKEELPEQPINEFTFKGQRYVVVPSLLKTQFQNFVSLENLLQHSDFIKVIHYVVAVMARKSETETLDDYDVEERAKEFLELPITTANRVSVFFYRFGKNFETVMQLYSNPELIIREKLKEIMIILKPQVGRGWFTNFVNSILRRLIIFLSRFVMKHYIGTVLKSSTTESKECLKKKK